MDSHDVEMVLRGIGADRVRIVNAVKVSCCCPLAWWTHGRGKDSSPSFVVYSTGDRGPTYGCLSCHETGRLEDLLLFLWTKGRDTLRWVYFLYGKIGSGDASKPKSERYMSKLADTSLRGAHPEAQRSAAIHTPPVQVSDSDGRVWFDYMCLVEADNVPEIPWSEYEPYTHNALPDYVTDRGLSAETAATWKLGYDQEMSRLLFPMLDHRGRLVAISGRLSCKECPRCGGEWIKPSDQEGSKRRHCEKCGMLEPPKYLHRKGFQRNLMLYGEHRAALDVAEDGRVYLVEGNVDTVSTWQARYRPVVGLLGSWPGQAQIEKLIRHWKRVIVIPDGDAAGRDMAGRVKIMLAGRMEKKTVVCETPDGLDPADIFHPTKGLSESDRVALVGEPPTLSAIQPGLNL